MNILRKGQESYSITVGSDTPRDGFYSELCRETEDGPVFVAEAFWSDQTSEFLVTVAETPIPFSVLEKFISQSRIRIPPSNNPVESNLFSENPEHEDSA